MGARGARIQRRNLLSLDRLIEDRTAFVIAHRLSTIRDADRVVVMDDGEIVESGTHEDLLAASGEYATLWRAQADEWAATDLAESD